MRNRPDNDAANMIGISQPNHPDTEKAVLCAVYGDGGQGTIPELIDAGCEPEWFWTTRYRIIYEAMLVIHSRGEVIDEITLATHLTATGELEKAGGHAEIGKIGDFLDVPSAVFFRNRKQLAGFALLRQSMRFAFRLVEEAQATDSTAAESFISEKEREFFSLTNGTIKAESLQHASLPAERAEQNIDRAIASQGKSVEGLKFGLSEIDRTMGGLKASEMTVLAARPSVGKTGLAMSLVRRVAIEEKSPVLVFSLETKSDKLVERMMFAEANVNGEQTMSGIITDAKLQALRKAKSVISAAPIYIDDTPRMTMALMAARARRLAASLDGRKLGMIVVDYLQLLQPSDKRIVREQQVAEISREFKLLISEIGCAGLILAQLNRESEKEKRPPRASDLRESGSLEQDADAILFLYRPIEENPNPKHVMVDVNKNRNGRTMFGRHGCLNFDKTTGRFTDSEKDPADSTYIPSRRAGSERTI